MRHVQAMNTKLHLKIKVHVELSGNKAVARSCTCLRTCHIIDVKFHNNVLRASLDPNDAFCDLVNVMFAPQPLHALLCDPPERAQLTHSVRASCNDPRMPLISHFD